MAGYGRSPAAQAELDRLNALPMGVVGANFHQGTAAPTLSSVTLASGPVERVHFDRSERAVSAQLEDGRMVDLVGLDGTKVQLSAGDSRARKRRIQGNTRRLFHQTSADVAKLIFSSQTFKRGSDGLAGGGIYFATTTEDTNHKKNPRLAPDPGPILSAEVLLGRVLTIDKNGDRSITFSNLLSRPGGPYDSVLIPRDNGHEYVVYNSDQARNIRQAACRDGAGCTDHSDGHRKNYCHKQSSQVQQQPKRQQQQQQQQYVSSGGGRAKKGSASDAQQQRAGREARLTDNEPLRRSDYPSIPDFLWESFLQSEEAKRRGNTPQAPQQQQQQPHDDPRPACKYGGKCYRTNPDHRKVQALRSVLHSAHTNT